jgi:hypothetical protein
MLRSPSKRKSGVLDVENEFDILKCCKYGKRFEIEIGELKLNELV